MVDKILLKRRHFVWHVMLDKMANKSEILL